MISIPFSPVFGQWTEANGPDMRNIEDFAVMGSTIFAAGWTGVFRSKDEGRTWEVASDDLSGKEVKAIIAGETCIFVTVDGVDGGLFRSSDMGNTWEKVSTGPNEGRAPATMLSVEETGDSGVTLYFGYAGKGVYASTDDGYTWVVRNNGLPDEPNITAFGAIGDRLFAASYPDEIFTSTNGGVNWVSTQSGLEKEFVKCFTALGADLYIATGGSIFSGLYRSTDLGASWSKVDGPFEGRYLRIVSARGNNLYAGTTTMGLFRSSDGGVSWVSANSGIPDDFIYDIGQSDAAMFVAAGGLGIFRSTDDGISWLAVSAGLSDYQVMAMFEYKSTLYACTQSGLSRMDGEGEHWTRIETAEMNSAIWCSAIVGEVIVLGTAKDGVLVSTDDGKSWQQRNNGLLDSTITDMAVSDGDLYIGTLSAGMYHSTDLGSLWNEVNDGVSTTYVSALYADDECIYRGAYASIYRSTDRGKSWTLRASGLPNTSPKAITKIGTALFASTWGVYRSLDEGLNWAPMTDALLGSFDGSMLVVETSLFAGCIGGEVFLSTDLGESWSDVGDSLNGHVQFLTRFGSNLYAGTRSNGVWKRPLSQVLVHSEALPESPGGVCLHQNYPNPFNPSTGISYTLPANMAVTLVVTDLLGQEVQRLVDGERREAGRHVEAFDAGKLPSGVYHCQLLVGNQVRSRSMLLLR
jgi:photosystem II stability/assembly factor-like uncharacterized protein